MPHWDWLAIFALSIVSGLLWSIVKLLEKISSAVGAIRWQLEQMEERQKIHTDYLHRIASHTAPKRKGPGALEELIEAAKKQLDPS